MFIPKHYLVEVCNPINDMGVALLFPQLSGVVGVTDKDVGNGEDLLNDFIDVPLAIDGMEILADHVPVEHFVDS
jgi:hypothetical protein